MLFTVRSGFVLQYDSVRETPTGRMTTPNFHPAGDTVDLDADTASQFAHGLEPVDAAAAAYLESLHPPVPAVTPDVAALIAAEVAKALAAAKAGK